MIMALSGMAAYGSMHTQCGALHEAGVHHPLLLLECEPQLVEPGEANNSELYLYFIAKRGHGHGLQNITPFLGRGVHIGYPAVMILAAFRCGIAPHFLFTAIVM